MSNNVEIVIGAKNQASKIMDDVGKSTQVLAKNVMTDGKKIEVAFSSIAVPLAVLGASMKVFDFAIDFFQSLKDIALSSANAFGESEDATRKLAIAIDLSGTATKDSLEKHNALADTLQRKLNIEDEVTKGLMTQASMLGVVDDQLDAVTKTAIGLATAMGTDLNEGLRNARLALDGNFIAISKQIPAIKAMATDEEKFAAVLALSEKGLVQKTAAADSATQADERAMLAIGELMESVGAGVLPLQALAFEGIEIVVNALNTAFGPALKDAGELFTGFEDTVVSGAQLLAEGVITFGTALEVFWGNIGTVFETVGDVVLLSLEAMRADIEQVLTVAIPAYAMWFADNFFNIMRDAGMAVVTVFSNLGTIIGEIFEGIWLVITGEQTIGDAMENVGRAAGRGLLDGFEATTTALPTIAERAMTDTEKILNSVIDQNLSNIAGEFEGKLTARLAAVDEALASKEVDSTDKAKANKKKPGFSQLGRKYQGGDSTEAILGATESRLLTRGRVDNAGEQVARNTNRMIEQNDELKAEVYGMRQSMDEINRKADTELEFVA